MAPQIDPRAESEINAPTGYLTFKATSAKTQGVYAFPLHKLHDVFMTVKPKLRLENCLEMFSDYLRKYAMTSETIGQFRMTLFHC